MGRYKKKEENPEGKYTCPQTIRFSPAMLAEIEAVRKTKLTEWVRQACRDRLEREKDAPFIGTTNVSVQKVEERLSRKLRDKLIELGYEDIFQSEDRNGSKSKVVNVFDETGEVDPDILLKGIGEMEKIELRTEDGYLLDFDGMGKSYEDVVNLLDELSGITSETMRRKWASNNLDSVEFEDDTKTLSDEQKGAVYGMIAGLVVFRGNNNQVLLCTPDEYIKSE